MEYILLEQLNEIKQIMSRVPESDFKFWIPLMVRVQLKLDAITTREHKYHS